MFFSAIKQDDRLIKNTIVKLIGIIPNLYTIIIYNTYYAFIAPLGIEYCFLSTYIDIIMILYFISFNHNKGTHVPHTKRLVDNNLLTCWLFDKLSNNAITSYTLHVSNNLFDRFVRIRLSINYFGYGTLSWRGLTIYK